MISYFRGALIVCLCSFYFAPGSSHAADAIIYPVTPAKSPDPTPAPVQIEKNRPPEPGQTGSSAFQPPESLKNQTVNFTYTVVKGDSLWNLSRRFHVSVETLRRINHLTTDALQPGELLLISESEPAQAPPVTTPLRSPVHAATRNPAPLTSNPVEPNNRPEEESARNPSKAAAPSTPPAQNPTSDQTVVATPKPIPAPAPHHVPPQLKIFGEAKKLAAENIEYNQSWQPPGARRPLVMDCSNTSRYLYWKVAGIDIGRTASDQYYFLHLKNRAWDVPHDSNGIPDRDYLKKNLQVGDLLFWENTYDSHRDPPITHVAIFLGANSNGQWIMAASESAGHGMTNHHTGPDFYYFNPFRNNGGYSTWLGFVHKTGRFVAIGRPLDWPKDVPIPSNSMASAGSP